MAKKENFIIATVRFNLFTINAIPSQIKQKTRIFGKELFYQVQGKNYQQKGYFDHGLKKEEFFEGHSVPRNKELMRIYKDLDFVEQLGSGIPRILKFYDKKDFKFSENFLRIILPSSESTSNTTDQVPDKYPASTPQVIALLKIFTGQHSRQELQDHLGLASRENFRINYLQPAIEQELVALTIPNKPRSSKQKYYLTEKVKEFIEDK